MGKAESLQWIPWKRYALQLGIDNNQPVFLGRFRLRKSAEKEAGRLDAYKGYKPEVIDTKLSPKKENYEDTTRSR